MSVRSSTQPILESIYDACFQNLLDCYNGTFFGMRLQLVARSSLDATDKLKWVATRLQIRLTQLFDQEQIRKALRLQDIALVTIFPRLARLLDEDVPFYSEAENCRHWLYHHRENLSQIREISLAGFGLTCLPMEIEDFYNLTWFSLHNNKFSKLPCFLLNLPIRYLNIYKNAFTHLPKELCKMHTLVELWTDTSL